MFGLFITRRIRGPYLIRKASNKNTKQENNGEWEGFGRAGGPREGRLKGRQGGRQPASFSSFSGSPSLLCTDRKDHVSVQSVPAQGENATLRLLSMCGS